MANATESAFGDPDTRIAQSDRWTVLLRPKQPTIGSLVVVCREPVQAFSALSAEAFAELGLVVEGVEKTLAEVVGYERINWLMLMMVDKDVHFHVVPRHEGTRRFEGASVADAGWPGPPALGSAVELEPAVRDVLRARLRAAWRRLAPAGVPAAA